jgi:D-xylose transport system substrate-binding protein
MRHRILAAVAVATVATTALAGCSSSSKSGGSGSSAAATNNKVGILLPDTSSSPRWVSADPNELANQCAKYNLNCKIYNANGVDATQEQQAQQLISQGVGVLLVVDLDASSGAQIEHSAESKGVAVIDYDRLTQGGNADYYVSYDNVKVGEDQGTALTQCPQVAGKTSVGYTEIDGAATDNNATLFAQGYNEVLSKTSGWTKLDDGNGNWSATTAQTVFQNQLGKNGSKINAVMVANDTMAQSVINVLQQQGLAGKVAVSGQDATPGGLDNIMAGTQCFTIYKPVAGEADVAIKLASQILAGQKPTAPAQTKDPSTGKEIPSYLATPIVITKANVAKPVTDGYETAASVCGTSAAIAKLCNANGITYTYSGS